MNYTHMMPLALMLLTAMPGMAQDKKEMNDSNTPLHLMQPAYRVGYGVLGVDEIKKDMDRVLTYLEATTPMTVEDKNTHTAITDLKKINENAQLKRGQFRLASYEWGVTYSAMLAAGEATGDKRYTAYATDRMAFLARVAPAFDKLLKSGKQIDSQMSQILTPHALDDGGAVCAAMMKARIANPKLNVEALIDNYFDFVYNKEFRLSDGIFARNRPHIHTVWLDDMFMGIPCVAWMGKYQEAAGKSGQAYYDEAAKQFMLFAKRMWVPESNLYRHGWVEAMTDHPAFFWGRANGWALLTACEVLDVLPQNHPQRAAILDLFRKHVKGICALQSADGLWHQLLNRNDSYLETSATAIYVYCLAHAIDKCWIDALTYGPTAVLGWHGVASQINAKGQVEGTCVGTGMAFDPSFYCYRPVNVFAAHGYGPVIWAGAEMIKLMMQNYPKMNDSAVQFYPVKQSTDAPIFNAVQ